MDTDIVHSTWLGLTGLAPVPRTCIGPKLDNPGAIIDPRWQMPTQQRSPPRRFAHAEYMSIDIEIASIACASRRFEAAPVKDGEMSARIADQFARLQEPRSGGDADAAHAEHEREEVLGYIE